MLLALGCLLAGVHLEWMFAVVGVLLATTLMMAERAEQYMWLVFIVGVVAVAAMFWIMRIITSGRPKGQGGPRDRGRVLTRAEFAEGP